MNHVKKYLPVTCYRIPDTHMIQISPFLFYEKKRESNEEFTWLGPTWQGKEQRKQAE
jgi:hypothetical protein